MRISSILLFCCCGLLSAETSYSQKARVTIKQRNAQLETVLNEIENQTDYLFLYNGNRINANKNVSVNVKNMPVNKLLTDIFSDSQVKYVMEGNHIILTTNDEQTKNVAQQGITVTGIVSDAQGEPMPGVNVTVKGTLRGVVTDVNGKYSIPVDNTSAVLVFSFVGYAAREQAVGAQTKIDVLLTEDLKEIEEVVVVGYGVMRKKDVTGALTSISTDKIDKSTIKSVDQMLQGRSSGLHMIQSSGMPGSSSTVRIRGGNSITGGNEPLYVIDGVPVYPGATGGQTDLSPLNTIAVTDIQSIEVLKDASSTAIYGARGANGVIMITTKRGATGKTDVTFDAYVGLQSPRKLYDLLNAEEFEDFSNEAQWRAMGMPADNRYPVYDPDVTPVYTDWQKELIKPSALMQNYTLSASGGDEKTRFLTTINYMDQEGIVKATDMQKLTLRANIDRDISKTVKFGLNMSLAQVNSNRVGAGVLGGQNGKATGFSSSQPNVPIYNTDHTYNDETALGEIFFNPVATVNEATNFNKRFRTMNNLYLDWEIIKGLSFRTTIGVDLAFGDQQSYSPNSTTEGQATKGAASVTASKSYMWVNENTLTYIKQFGKHRINAMVGLSQQTQKDQDVRAQSQNFMNDKLAMYHLGSAADEIMPNSSTSEWALLSYLGRVNYNFNEKYLFTGSLRADGSSRFGKRSRWGYFPSAAVAWRASEEDFIKQLGVFSNLKVRASYGRTGNQDGIGVYPSMALLGSATYSLNGDKVTGYRPTQVANYDLRWETTRQTDLGIEAGFFDNRLNLAVDLYYKTTHDLLLSVVMPASSGYSSGLRNIGEVENKGVEWSINAVPFTGDFRWDIDFNISFNKNKVVSLGDVDEMMPSSPTGTGAGMETSRRLIVGQPLGIFYGYLGDGIFSTTDNIASSAQPAAKPGDIRYKNLNGNNTIDEEDRTVIGCAQPKFFGGMTHTFAYKGFDLSIFTVFSVGNDIYNGTKAELEGLEGNINQLSNVKNRWTETNQHTDVPRAVAIKLTSRPWDYLVEDGSFFRIQNISLGYNFPGKLLDHTRVVRSARLYMSLQNFFTFTDYSGLDPEVSRYGQNNIAMGYDHFAYPMVKTVLFGVNLSF